jgi:hypothetical protein
MSEIFRRHLKKYAEIQPQELSSYRLDGQRDGKNNFPPADSTSFEGALLRHLTEAKAAWQAYLSDKRKQQDEIENKIHGATYSIETEIPQEIAAIQTKASEEQTLFNSREGLNSAKSEKLAQDLEAAKHDFDRLKSQLNRPVVTKFEKFYLPFLLFLAFAEVPVNREAFALYFEGANAVILVLSLAVGALLIFFAHVIGHTAKETTCVEVDPPVAKMYAGIAGIGIISAILIYILAVMREGYAKVMAGDDTFNQLFEENAQLDIMSQSFFEPLTSVGISLMVLNITIFVAGILASFFRHDAHGAYEKIYKTYERMRVAQYKNQEKVEKAINAIQEKYNRQVATIRSRQQSIERDRAQFEKDLAELNQSTGADFDSLITGMERLVVTYNEGNQQARSDRAPPYLREDVRQSVRRILSNE